MIINYYGSIESENLLGSFKKNVFGNKPRIFKDDIIRILFQVLTPKIPGSSNGMCSIRYPGPMKFSALFFLPVLV